jgi:hypothetical protein
MIVFDKLIDLIYSKRMELQVNVNSPDMCEFIPKIYYIGEGKSGSTSIKKGFSNVNVAHWHDVRYFEKIYETKLLSSNNYDLYDLVIYIGNKYNFKPVIIESIRNTINIEISKIFQFIKKDRGDNGYLLKQINKFKTNNNSNNFKEIVKKNITISLNSLPLSCNLFKKHFNIDLSSTFDKNLNYYFNDDNNVYLLFLKFENIKNWSEIINNHLPYTFVLKHTNKTTNEFYNTVKTNLKFTKKEIQPFLDCPKMTFFYSNEEIDNISKKFTTD